MDEIDIMQENEDEPEDVRNATPVEDQIRKSQVDEIIKQKGLKRSFKPEQPQHCCPKTKPAIERAECCPEKRNKNEQLPIPPAFCKDPYKRVKQELVPRHCLTKDKHLDVLATPKYIRQNNETEHESNVIRRIRTLYPRTEWLSKPTKRRMLMTLVYQGATLPSNMVDHLIEVLEGETAITPEQAEDLVRKKQQAKKKSKKKETKGKCEEVNLPKREESLAGGDPSLDLEVAYCQYSMAHRFIRSILNWKCSCERDDYKDIAEVILERLSKQLNYAPIGKEDRKSEQMRILADVFACWISDILMQVAEKYGNELDKEAEDMKRLCEEVRKEPEDEEEQFVDEEDGFPRFLEAHCGSDHSEKYTQFEEDEEDELNGLNEEKKSTASSEDCVDEEQQTEPRPKADCGTTTHTRMEKRVAIDECSQANVKCKDEEELDKICSRLSNAFQTDVPFVTFAKIIDALYCMIGCEPENDLADPIDNRIHRAIYEKFEDVMCREDPKLLSGRTRDILDVVTGKLAKWLRKALNHRQINFFAENPGQIESREVRDWAKWMDDTVNVADTWAHWIHKIKMEAECISRAGGITRGDWQDWTGKFETNAMLFRRKYLETVHQQHHNNMMYCEREVLKTCTKRKPEYDEHVLKSTNYESCLMHK